MLRSAKIIYVRGCNLDVTVLTASAREFEEFQCLCAFEHRVHRINGLPVEIADAIEGSKMDSARDHLNELLDKE